MPPRLPSLPAFTAPRAFMARISRPFSSTPAVAQSSNPTPNPVSNLLELDQKQVHSTDRIRGLIKTGSKTRMEGTAAKRRSMLESLKDKKKSDDYIKQMPRRWRTGDVYAPHDLSPVEMDKWRKLRRPQQDVIDMLSINPVDYYSNFSMISEFMTSFGQIMHSNHTGLRAVNQRRISKAIRRAIGMGIHPSVHHHPEILKKRLRTISQLK